MYSRYKTEELFSRYKTVKLFSGISETGFMVINSEPVFLV